MNDATSEEFYSMNQTEYDAICAAEGFLENAVPPILSSENHVGLNQNYTDFAYGIELSEKAAKSIGFKLGTLGKNASVSSPTLSVP